MTVLVWVLAAAALLLGLALRRRRLARLRGLRRLVAELRRELSTLDGRYDIAMRRSRWISLQNSIERRRTRAAIDERNAAQDEAARTLRRVWRLEAEQERLLRRVEYLALAEHAGITVDSEAVVQAAMAGIDQALRELGPGGAA